VRVRRRRYRPPHRHRGAAAYGTNARHGRRLCQGAFRVIATCQGTLTLPSPRGSG
jgi:hypothetical protein